MRRASVALALCACGATRSPPSAPAASELIDQRPWIGWRLDDPARPLARVCPHDAASRIPGVGRAECWRGGPDGAIKVSDDGFVGDAEAHDAGSGSGCSLSYREDSEGTTAELVLDNVVIDRARRESEDNAAAIRGGFSPDGRWLAIVKLEAHAREIDVVEVRIVRSPCER